MAPEERAQLLAGFAALFGGGIIAYEATRSVKEGDLLKVEGPSESREETAAESAGAFIAGVVGLGLSVKLTKDFAEEVGVRNLGYATAASLGLFMLLRYART